MIGFDTNLVVRLMVEDDKAQVRLARQLLAEAAYKVPRPRILAAIHALVADDRFCFEDRHRVTAALNLYQRGKGDLADYLISLCGEAAGARTTYTFDRALRGDSRFTVVRT